MNETTNAAPDPAHDAKVTDDCYGMTGGVRVDCSCGDYWVLRAGANHEAVQFSIGYHIAWSESR